jgi:glycogen operon protein
MSAVRFMTPAGRPDDLQRVESKGRPYPIGATVLKTGVNFSIFSRDASSVDLLFFDREDAAQPSDVIHLEPASHLSYHYWHIFVPGASPGQIYGFLVDGPFDPQNGLRFDRKKLLLDPYGRSVVVPPNYKRALTSVREDMSRAMKSVVVDPGDYDWEGDTPLKRPSSRTIIYEMHVRGFTADVNSGVSANKRGTYAGLIEKIPYLQDLGVTAVELLPLFQFDAQDAPSGLVNYWGYAPVSFFAPHRAYSSRQDALGPVDEFRDMVKALHRAGIEVILDVVFNHTAEGDERGPAFCFRGIDNVTYYILETNRVRYANFSGCGNTFNGNNPIVRRLILDSIRYWVEQMHVDGFRFDLASILARDSEGNVLSNPPVLWDIESDPVLAGTKLIAEAWDSAGLYQVGSFIGDSWKEWNGRFRDDVRAFFRGDEGMVSQIANRLLGSPDIYSHERREAEQSVNFVASHDGFTLSDLVSYNQKHNDQNEEGNRDGSDDSRSWNCGMEGPSQDPAIEKLRNRQIRNFLTVTMLSLGVPMIVMGDEVRRSQRGNNNAYCQDNDISWLDWSLLPKCADLHRFVRLLIARRTRRDTGLELRRLSLNQVIRQAKYTWHGVKLAQPDWSHSSHSLALEATLSNERLGLYLILNAYWEPLSFELPLSNPDVHTWRRWIDTALDTPNDIFEWRNAPQVHTESYRAESRSVVVLFRESGPVKAL